MYQVYQFTSGCNKIASLLQIKKTTIQTSESEQNTIMANNIYHPGLQSMINCIVPITSRIFHNHQLKKQTKNSSHTHIFTGSIDLFQCFKILFDGWICFRTMMSDFFQLDCYSSGQINKCLKYSGSFVILFQSSWTSYNQSHQDIVRHWNISFFRYMHSPSK